MRWGGRGVGEVWAGVVGGVRRPPPAYPQHKLCVPAYSTRREGDDESADAYEDEDEMMLTMMIFPFFPYRRESYSKSQQRDEKEQKRRPSQTDGDPDPSPRPLKTYIPSPQKCIVPPMTRLVLCQGCCSTLSLSFQ